ncbi:MAG: hypothetical protein IE878_05675 [Epsilonproteobacteria bacterium]|nr:hypothetical protein [Thiotrichales bacterium]MBD3839857.1 hypothetical protein [Campylobacterota bacterium]
MLFIDSIERVAQQGRTSPLVCKGEDGNSYVVKYKEGTAGTDGLVKEWLFGCLARYFGLEVPSFEEGFLSGTLIRAFPFHNVKEFIRSPEEGSVFASKMVENVEEFKMVNLHSVSESYKKDLFVFDLWIKNHDRCLSEMGGNVNLLWSISESKCYVIDHNLALDDEPSPEFLDNHVFRRALGPYDLDLITRQNYEEKMKSVLENWDNCVSSCPKCWLEDDSFSMGLQDVKRSLEDDANGKIWERLK